MITVDAIYTSPVKSLGLVHPETVRVEFGGIVEDRRFYLVDEKGGLLTQRQIGPLVQVQADYRAEPEWLGLRFPDGSTLDGPVEMEERVNTRIWGRRVPGHVVGGDWGGALSDFCQRPLQLVHSDLPGQCYDEFPISILSQASVDILAQQSSGAATIGAKRFRPTFFLGGCQPHEEDDWLGHAMQVGNELRLRVMSRDPRCAITTHDPETGAPDVDTLRLILSYRPHPGAPYFGVYGMVERPGNVSVGDQVTILE